MATIYKFLIEQKITQGGGGGRKGDTSSSPKSKSASKKGNKSLDIGTSKGGVEHNRKMRAINPVLNKATGGLWEKGVRVGRAGAHLVKFDAETGAFAGISGVAVTILVSFLLRELMRMQFNWIEQSRGINSQNFKMLENGMGAIHTDYDIAVNVLNGRATYNQNK